MVEQGGRALAAYMKPREAGQANGEFAEEVAEVVKTLSQVMEYWLADPQRTVELQTRLGKAYLDLWAAAAKRLAGEDIPPVAKPAASDKRFADPEWTQNQFFDFLKQAYLLTTDWADKLVRDAAELDPHTRQKAEFYVRQIGNALSPTNFVLTNPELLRETLLSNADNLVRGMNMLAEDIEAGGGDLKIRQSDSSMFEVGRNLATTPGKVIFQNELMQLIQYAPTTETVLKRPLADRAAVDQQILRARPDAGEILHQMVRRSGPDRIRHLLGQSRRPSRGERLRRLCARRPACGARRHPAGDRRR